MPSAAAIARSSGVVINPRTSSASAPTYTVVTVMAAISLRGYCRTLIVFIACKPAMRMTKLTTIASTGRLMKRSVKDFMSILGSRIHRRRIHLRFRREIIVDRYRHSIAQFENSRAHDGFIRFQPVDNRNEIAAGFAHPNKLLTNRLRFLAALRVLLFL